MQQTLQAPHPTPPEQPAVQPGNAGAEPIDPGLPATDRASRRAVRRATRRRIFTRARTLAFRLLALVAILIVAQTSVLAWRPNLQAQVAAATSGLTWDLTNWTLNALSEKAAQVWRRPAAHYSPAEGAAFVEIFMERAGQIRELERNIERMSAEDAPAGEIDSMADQLAALRLQQAQDRPTAEAIIEAQVSTILSEYGIGVLGRPWPPVLFTFTESPAKLVVSPRDRIGTATSRMVQPGLPLETITAVEESIQSSATAAGGVSAYIAPTGGLGAFPTLVVNNGNLEWTLSTVAHEWVHTYLAFFPLGFNYGSHPDNILINETVADIIGDEAGRRVLERFYPELLPPEPPDGATPASELLPPEPPPQFDFRAEMRHTRDTLDKFLHFGLVEEAEKYLELRRQLFVENGYAIRKLNQAWFAFHGSYGTSPAASTATTAAGPALAPMVQALRGNLPDLATFLRTVRTITDREGLERLLATTTPG